MARKKKDMSVVVAVGLAGFIALCALAYLLLSSTLPARPQQTVERRAVDVSRLLTAFDAATALERSLEASNFGQARLQTRKIRELIAGTLTVEEMKLR